MPRTRTTNRPSESGNVTISKSFIAWLSEQSPGLVVDSMSLGDLRGKLSEFRAHRRYAGKTVDELEILRSSTADTLKKIEAELRLRSKERAIPV